MPDGQAIGAIAPRQKDIKDLVKAVRVDKVQRLEDQRPAKARRFFEPIGRFACPMGARPFWT
jgi:hypothetical protein